MTDTLAFITDTHLFRDDDGFHRQPQRIDLMPAIAEGLKKQLAEARVDLLIHGGDIVEHANEENIPAGLDMLSGFGIKAAAVLGNHDMTTETSCAAYYSMAETRKDLTLANAVIELAHVDVILLDNDWNLEGTPGKLWRHDAPACLAKDSADWLEAALTAGGEKPAILVTHAPVDVTPARLYEADDPPSPDENWAKEMNQILDRHSRVKLLLTGHYHTSWTSRYGSRVHMCTSSITEVPFEYRIITFEKDRLMVKTHAAIPMPADTAYDEENEWVNGDPLDRSFGCGW